MRVPSFISIGLGVKILKFILGGVITDKFSGFEKKSKTVDIFCETTCSFLSTYSFKLYN